MSAVLDKYPRHHPDTAGRRLDDEVVVVTPADGFMHTLNPVGAWIWENADGSRSVRELAGALGDAFEVDAEVALDDLVTFVTQLAEKGIVELLDAPGGA